MDLGDWVSGKRLARISDTIQVGISGTGLEGISNMDLERLLDSRGKHLRGHRRRLSGHHLGNMCLMTL